MWAELGIFSCWAWWGIQLLQCMIVGTGSFPRVKLPRRGVNHGESNIRSLPALHLCDLVTGYRVTFAFTFTLLPCLERRQCGWRREPPSIGDFWKYIWIRSHGCTTSGGPRAGCVLRGAVFGLGRMQGPGTSGSYLWQGYETGDPVTASQEVSCLGLVT